MDLPLPTFLILGAPKCGTTSLYFHLDAHPDVCMSEPKETYFLESRYELGLERYARDHFAHWSGQPARGDASPANLFVPSVPERIRASLPEARLVVLLRNPVDRAHAHWWMNHASRRDPLDFAAALAEERERLAAGRTFEGPAGQRHWEEHLARVNGGRVGERIYLDAGHYAPQIARYLERFPHEQLLVLLLEELEADEERVLGDLLRFLDLDPARLPAGERAVRGQNLGFVGTALRDTSRRLGVEALVPEAMKLRLRALLHRLGDRRAPMDPATRSELVAWFEPRNRELEALLGRDLTHWDA